MKALKASINNKIKAVKQGSHKSTDRHDEYIGHATKASAMLDGLKLWHEVVEDEEFIKALSEFAEEGSEATRQSCGMLKAIVEKDFKKATKCFASLLAIDVPKVQNEDPIIQELIKECLKSHWNNTGWNRFCRSVSSTVSGIIRKIMINNPVLEEIFMKPRKKLSHISLLEHPLYDWMSRLNHKYLHVETSPKVESLRMIKCFYDINSYIELLFVGSEEYLGNLTFNDLRKELKGKMTKAYVFYYIHGSDCRLYKDETTVLPEGITKEGCYLAILIPNLPITQELDNSIQYALKRVR